MKKVLKPAVDQTVIATERLTVDTPIPKESRRNAAVNPAIESAVQSGSVTAGSSTCVSPTPHYVPRIFDIDWLVGIVAFIHALLDPEGEVRRRSNTFISIVQETIDMNDYLPTSYDDMAGWRTIPG